MEAKEKKGKETEYINITVADVKEAEDKLHAILMRIDFNTSLQQEDYKEEIHKRLAILLAILPEEYDGYTTNELTIIWGTKEELDNLLTQGKEGLNIADDTDYFKHTFYYGYSSPEEIVAQIPIS